MNARGTDFWEEKWIQLAQDRVHSQVLVLLVSNFRVLL